MKKNYSLLLMLCLCITKTLAQTDQEELLISLSINELDQKQDLLVIQAQDQWYVECFELESTPINIQLLMQKNIDGKAYCQINSAPITAKHDEIKHILALDVPIAAMKGSQHFNHQQDLTPQPAPFGSYLNYDLLYKTLSSEQDIHEIGLKNELNVFWKDSLFQNSILMRQTKFGDETENQFTRLFSQLNIENPQRLTTWQIGDSISPSTPAQRGVYFAGVQYGTSFMQRPSFVYWNIPTIQGSALTPSNIDLYINGIKSYSNKVNPGEFNIESGAFFNGDGKAQLVIEDVLGNKTVQDLDLSVNNQLLKKGLNDYNFALGRIRYNFDEKSNDYRDYFASAYYRSGISNRLNLGLNAQYSEDIQTFGVFSNQFFPHIGILNLGAAYSHADQKNGYKLHLGFSKSSTFYNLGFNSELTNRNFTTLGLEQNSYLPKFDHLLYFGMNNIPYLGHLTLNYVEQRQHAPTVFSDKKIFSMRGGRPITHNLYFNYGINQELAEQDEFSFDVSLSYQFDAKRSAFLHQSKDTTGIHFSQADQALTGLDYYLSARASSDDVYYNADALIKRNFGDIHLRYNKSNDSSQAQANLKGAFTLLDQRVGITKAVNYPFTLVRIADQPNIDIYRNNEHIGQTNHKGELFVHRLIPYTEQNLSFNQDQLPIEYATPIRHQNVIPYNLRGYVVNFPILKSKDIQFKLLDAEGNALPAGSLLTASGHDLEPTPIGQQGLVTVYGLLEGSTYHFKVQTSPTESCQFTHQMSNQNNENLLNKTCQ